MTFANPAGLAALLLIPAIIALYLFRQRFTELVVPSLQLFLPAIKTAEAKRPWEKLRRNLLMILQLILALLLALALARPVLSSGDEQGGVILVIDGSMSMMAEDGESDDNRFEEARRLIGEYIRNSNAEYTLAVLTQTPYIAISRSKDKAAVLSRLEGLEASYCTTDEPAAASLLSSLSKAQEGGLIRLYADKDYNFSVPHDFIPIGTDAPNLAVSLISHEEAGDGLVCLVKLRAYGADFERRLSLFGDGSVLDTRNVSISAGEELDCYFSVPDGVTELEALLSEGDVLPADDRAYLSLSEGGGKRALLVTERNSFLLSALSLYDGLSLSQSDEDAATLELSGYDLYVFDGSLPDELPTDGQLMIVNPPAGNAFIETGEAAAVGTEIQVLPGELTRYIESMDFALMDAPAIELPSWAVTDVRAGDRPLIFHGQTDTRRAVVIGFDLHRSDLPLTKDFPILLHNALAWLLPDSAVSGSELSTGGSIDFNLSPNADYAAVISQSGDEIQVAPPFPASSFNQANEPGFYTLIERGEGLDVSRGFAVNALFHEEQNIAVNASETATGSAAGTAGLTGTFDLSPVILAVMLALGIAEWLVYIARTKGRSAFVRAFNLAVRLVLTAVLVLALIDFSVRRGTDAVATVIAFDLSASTGTQAELYRAITESVISTGKPGDLNGILSFGGDSGIETLPKEDLIPGGLLSIVDKSETNISGAITNAASLLPDGNRKRVILVSDGLETEGQALNSARNLALSGVTLDTLYVDRALSAEVQLSSVTIPKELSRGMSYDIEVNTFSLTDTPARIQIYKNDRLILERETELRAGDNSFVFSDTSDEGGGLDYRAEIFAEGDTFAENNSVSQTAYVEDVPNVLAVDNGTGSSSELTRLLQSADLDVSVVNATALPSDVNRLAAYDAVILCDVNEADMPNGFTAALESYAKDQGGGVIATGGENSYALGGYRNTPLEELLPVTMDLTDKETQPNAAVVLVIDRSGSMDSGQAGVSKLELAKESVIRSVEAFDERDKVGIIAFDDLPMWVIAPTSAGENAAEIQDAAAMISPGGGTSILPALSAAYEGIRQEDAKLRHIILLTDGQAEQSGYAELLNSMNEEGITLSTIAVGGDSDQRLLQSLAESGGGRYYYTDEYSDLPKVFLKEAQLGGKTYLNNYDFYPKAGYSPILDGIEAIPPLSGYVSTTAKPRAELALSSDKDEPILAVWQYGLARTAAWTTDINGAWTGDFLQAAEGRRVFLNTLSYVLKTRLSENMELSAEQGADGSKLTLTMPYDSGLQGVSAYAAGNGGEYPLEFSAEGPGRYGADVSALPPGSYSAVLNFDRADGQTQTGMSFSLAYSKEYDLRNPERGEQLMRQLAEAAGGRTLSPDDFAFSADTSAYNILSLRTPLLIAACALLFADVFLRRFSTAVRSLELWLTKITRRKEKPPKQARPAEKNTVPAAKVTPAPADAKPEPELAAKPNTANVLASSRRKRRG